MPQFYIKPLSCKFQDITTMVNRFLNIKLNENVWQLLQNFALERYALHLSLKGSDGEVLV